MAFLSPSGASCANPIEMFNVEPLAMPKHKRQNLQWNEYLTALWAPSGQNPNRKQCWGMPSHRYWTHPSVVSLAEKRNPIEVVVERARALVLTAIEAGWSGPPFDPFVLAELLKIHVVPRDDIQDARIVPGTSGARMLIEYNPNRPKARIRYSIAHEIAHTLFPDCRDRIRHRAAREHMEGDDWQLEMLCNIGASELLMPVGSFPELADESLSIDHLVSLRSRYEVSAEALLLRFARLTRSACLVFAASRRENEPNQDRYQIDYVTFPTDWRYPAESGSLLPAETAIRECTAIGFTATSDEAWTAEAEQIHIEAVGIAPYPGHSYPRIVGFATPRKRKTSAKTEINYVKGDATQPRGSGPKIIVHIVNDRAARWGGGFAREVRNAWPEVQQDFIEWTQTHRHAFRLGACRISPIDETLVVASLVCQHGYGPSPKPRIRYNALESGLLSLATVAAERGASVHMPRIGCGQARGRWEVVMELIEQSLTRHGISVTVYDLPNAIPPSSQQQSTLFSV